MTYLFESDAYIIRLVRGEKLIESLVDFVSQNDIKSGWINGLGAATAAELGYYDLSSKQYQWQKFDQLMEILSLQGNIAWQDDKPVLHLHGVLSDQNMQSIGGHVKELTVGGTCEIYLQPIGSTRLSREHDPDTGLNLLSL